MDGQCQDEFRHCTDRGSGQERINVTFRWVKHHVASCSFFKTGVACCLPTCARFFFLFLVWSWWRKEVFGLFGFSLVSCAALLVITLVCTRLGFQRCASCWTCPWGGGRWGHYICYPWGVWWAAQNTASRIDDGFCDFACIKLYMLALVGRESLHSYDACMVYWVQGASRRNCS